MININKANAYGGETAIQQNINLGLVLVRFDVKSRTRNNLENYEFSHRSAEK